jgi:hypothetical protein
VLEKRALSTSSAVGRIEKTVQLQNIFFASLLETRENEFELKRRFRAKNVT